MKKHVITTYSFDELSNKAKEKVISDYIEFWLDINQTESEHISDNFKEAIAKCERMQTPWFIGSYIYEYCKDEIIEEIKITNYDFYADGAIFMEKEQK